jgi:phosphomethylpyrimidine synthase
MGMLDIVAKLEGVSKSRILKAEKAGSLVLVRNAGRDILPLAIGLGVKTKVNANIGFSPMESSFRQEMRKADAAVSAGADTLMDLSVGGDASQTRKKIMKKYPIPLGTVPIYHVFEEKHLEFSLEDYLQEIEKQAMEGVDYMTIHAGLTLKALKETRKRLIPVTSRGGAFLASWMTKNKMENPLYTGYDDILEILREYDVTISLGDGLRPACIHDATDNAQIEELKVLGRLTERAWKRNVKVIVEGPGHVPLNQIERNMKLQKRICKNAPFYVLGPLVTDIGAGYDHITSAIGGAVAGMYGADFLCYVTPSEHLGLPTTDEVYEGVIASKIAAHAADIVKLGRTERDYQMSQARRKLDWERMYELALDPNLRKKHKKPKAGKECSMCGEYCALKMF